MNNTESKRSYGTEERKSDECKGREVKEVKGRETFMEFKKKHGMDLCRGLPS